MHFFQTNYPIKKIGNNEYIIGDNHLDPLVLIKDKELIVDTITAKNISGFSGGSNQDSITGLSGNFEVLNITESFSGSSGNFEVLNVTGPLIVNGVDIYPAISGLLAKDEIHDAQISGLQERIDNLAVTVGELEADGQTYSFFTDLNSGDFTYEITFPSSFDSIPKINSTLEVTGEGKIVDYIVSGINTGSYFVVFPERLPNDNYRIHTLFDSNGQYAGEEAFELDSDGDLVPSNSPLISDTMWILRNQTDLELRNNFWRYNTGPEAFTDEISF